MQGEIAKAGDAAQPVVARGAESMREMSDQALGKARDQVDERTARRSGSRCGRSRMRRARSATALRDQAGQGAARARLVEGIAERVDRLGSYLEASDANSMLDELDRLGRRSPAAVMAGGVVVGILAARFLKASSENRTRRANGGSPPARPRPRSTAAIRCRRPRPTRRACRLAALHARDRCPARPFGWGRPGEHARQRRPQQKPSASCRPAGERDLDAGAPGDGARQGHRAGRDRARLACASADDIDDAQARRWARRRSTPARRRPWPSRRRSRRCSRSAR